ncbi:MAG: ChbG/HpnK family deacetylase, partial [Lachnospiraceae bacterium]|nr:ChbG/HpnK family deacetylase [Lachnospiraceae bacterium]
MINADDFGLNESVNAAICEAFEKGLIDRTTLMVNMPFADEAMKLARENGFADRVGLHVNLTSGRPLTDDMAKEPVMCNSEGEFTADFARNLKTRFFLPIKTRRRVEAEIRAQFEKYAKLGGTLWHIDSHHHVHTDPSIWSPLKKVIRDYPVTSVRLGRNMYKGGNPLMRLYKTMLNASIKKRCEGNP